jgi:serine/threonine protein kinase
MPSDSRGAPKRDVARTDTEPQRRPTSGTELASADVVEGTADSPRSAVSADTILSLPTTDVPPDEPDELPVPDDIVDGKYKVLSTLGVGGMGVVVHARDLTLERDVALKLIRGTLVPSAEVRERFLVEARTMARLRHENIVAVHAFGELATSPYFVMEYVPGTDLEAVLKERRGEPFRLEEAMRFLRQIASAVDAIHEAGAVHRDLKPSNVLIGSGLRVVVTDLGLAHLVEQPIRGHYAVAGTPGFIAPELIWAKKEVSAALLPRVDVYALAVIAFELLTGQLPFVATSVTELLRRQKESPAPLATEVQPELSVEIAHVLRDGLHPEPEERIPTAGELVRRLEGAHRKTTEQRAPVRVVIADDDEDVRDLAAAIIEEAFPEARVETYEDGTQAFAALEREPAGLALLDLHMPGLDGIELTARLRLGSRPHLPIIVMTAVGGASDWKVLSELGANAFLVKPFDEDALVLATRRVLGYTTKRRPMVG